MKLPGPAGMLSVVIAKAEPSIRPSRPPRPSSPSRRTRSRATTGPSLKSSPANPSHSRATRSDVGAGGRHRLYRPQPRQLLKVVVSGLAGTSDQELPVVIEEVNNLGVTFAEGKTVEPVFSIATPATFSFEGTGRRATTRRLDGRPGESLTVEGESRVASERPAGRGRLYRGQPDGSFKVFVRDPFTAPFRQEFPVVVEKVENPGVPFAEGSAYNGTMRVQAIFPFDGRGKDSVANDYRRS